MSNRQAQHLSGRVIAITGGARGIGLATAKAAHARGARVAIGDVDGGAAKEAGASLGEDVLALELDVTDEKSFGGFLGEVERRFGALDVLVNNAGIMPIGPFLDESVSRSRRAVDVNVMGPLIGTQLALTGMVQRGRGHIVNVASAAGKSPVPGGVTYAATKAAIVSLTESIRVEHAGSGVSFTCVMPSFTNTELISGTSGTKFIRTVQPDEVARAIVRAVESGKPDVYVPRVIGFILKTQPLIGRKLRDLANHAIKADRTFLDVDKRAREGYDARIGSGPE
ncbi:SDR family oxidoreductase [Haloechinothrix salitolerans]|uniref:SDR family oxidoreductase n=1 Tax=Haloechinothrix salitolerans TaxID=926830 RepID=A0ABW2BT36_9PSEU